MNHQFFTRIIRFLATVMLALCQPAAVFAQPMITNQPRNQTNVAGTTATFTVGATGAEPLSYQWRSYANSTSFTNILFGTEATLALTNVQSTSRQFGVVVTDSGGSVTSSLARLTVLLPPSITGQPSHGVGDLGGSATFSVTASGVAPLTYQWRWNTNVLAGQTNRTLVLTNLQLTHLGQYSVVVSNFIGSTTSQMAGLGLNITLAPRFDPALSIAAASNGLAVSWRGEGIVQAAGSPSGPWTDVGGIRKNFFLSTNSSMAMFHRLRNPHPRTARLFVPSRYRAGTKLPVIFSVHAFNRSSDVMESYVPLRALAESEGFLYVLADGVMNPSGNRFWNASGGCCDFSNQEINDVAFFRELITMLQAEYDADPKRIHFFGHSNGGFMSYRMAQEHSDLIASVASLAGAMDRVSSLPPPNHPVSVLQIHGTQDTVIPYAGGIITALPSTVPVTGARESVQRWADWNGCSTLQADPAPSLDLDSSLAGSDTVVTKTTNCVSGVTAELWTINNASHFPSFTPNFARELVNWLLNHPKL